MAFTQLTRREFLKWSAAGICGLCLTAGCGRRPSAAPEPYWQKNKKTLMSDFDSLILPVQGLIIEQCGQADGEAVVNESRQAFEALLPQVPDIGGEDNALTETLYLSAVALSFYRSMLAHGQPVEQSGRIMYRAMELLFDFNDPLAAAQSNNATGKSAQDEFRRMARWSDQSGYPEDWKLAFVEGDGLTFDFGVDYTECGIVKFYQAQKALELAPYMCLGDFPLSEAAGTGLVRTTTLARGGPCCDFRFKAGRPIQREWTPGFLK